MWLMTTLGFYSVVQALPHKNTPQVMVRARDIEHLKNLQKQFPEKLGKLKIRTWANRDYPFRMIVDKYVWAELVMLLSCGIDYTNFKSACEEKFGMKNKYCHALHEVWAVMLRNLQGFASRYSNLVEAGMAAPSQRFSHYLAEAMPARDEALDRIDFVNQATDAMFVPDDDDDDAIVQSILDAEAETEEE